MMTRPSQSVGNGLFFCSLPNQKIGGEVKSSKPAFDDVIFWKADTATLEKQTYLSGIFFQLLQFKSTDQLT